MKQFHHYLVKQCFIMPSRVVTRRGVYLNIHTYIQIMYLKHSSVFNNFRVVKIFYFIYPAITYFLINSTYPGFHIPLPSAGQIRRGGNLEEGFLKEGTFSI